MTEAVTLEVGGVQYDVAPSAVAIRLLGLDGTEIAKLDNTGRWASPDGTVALPGITFPGDPDTGIARVAANSLAIAVGGGEGLIVTGVASAVNEITVTNAATGNAPKIAATGGDADIGIDIDPKGSGTIQIGANNSQNVTIFLGTASGLRVGRAAATPALQVVGAVANSVTGVSVTPGATTVAPIIAAIGSDANIDLVLAPKGTGGIKFGTGATPTLLTGSNGLNVNNSANTATIVQFPSAGGVDIYTGGLTVGKGTTIPAGGTAGLGAMFSSTANFGVFFGSGAPTLSAAKGSMYLRSDGSGTTDRAYVNTDGGTTWTALTTAA